MENIAFKREIQTLYNLGLEDYEVQYLVRQKYKQLARQTKWN